MQLSVDVVLVVAKILAFSVTSIMTHVARSVDTWYLQWDKRVETSFTHQVQTLRVNILNGINVRPTAVQP